MLDTTKYKSILRMEMASLVDDFHCDITFRHHSSTDAISDEMRAVINDVFKSAAVSANDYLNTKTQMK